MVNTIQTQHANKIQMSEANISDASLKKILYKKIYVKTSYYDPGELTHSYMYI